MHAAACGQPAPPGERVVALRGQVSLGPILRRSDAETRRTVAAHRSGVDPSLSSRRLAAGGTLTRGMPSNLTVRTRTTRYLAGRTGGGKR
jgi:hypothetical protein